MRYTYTKGMGLIEILVGCAIIVTGIIALSGTFTSYIKYALSNDQNIQAAYLVQEGLEGMSFLRDKGWIAYIQPLSTTTTYSLNWSGGYWQTTTTNTYIDSLFSRQINITDVKRDGTGKIAAAGTYDPNTKKITVTLAYRQGHATTTQVISTYIANLYTN